MLIVALYDFFIFLFGLCIGSFLNVVIYRLEKGENFAVGRSYCPKCKHQLIWIDLIPVLSFLLLRGKCRYCKAKISWQYPAVEISTALIFLLIFNLKFEIYNQFEIFQFLNLAFLLYVASSLIVIFVYDVKYYLIPDKILFPAIIVTFIFHILDFGISPNVINYVVAACIASAFFLIIYVISRGRWMGFGDVKLAILLGLLLGFPHILLGLFLSFFFGAIIGVALLFFKKKGLKSEVPFAPFLIIGTLVALFWADQIIPWYFNLFLF